MPLYEFKCSHCEHSEEMLFNAHESLVYSCPKCQAGIMQKQISSFGSYSIKGNNSASTPPKSTVRTPSKNEK